MMIKLDQVLGKLRKRIGTPLYVVLCLAVGAGCTELVMLFIQ